jgi:MFS family permease
MGVSGAFIGIAAVIGPFIAGVLRDKHGAGAVFLLSATLMLVTSLLFWRLFKEPAPQGSEQTVGKKTGVSLLNLALRLRLATSYLAALALTIGLGTLVTHLPIVMAERGLSATRTGLAFTVFAGVAMIGMASPLSHVSDRYGRLGTMIAGLILVGGGMAALGMSTGFSSVAVGMGTFGLGFGLLFPAMTALVAEEAEWRERGKAFGIFYAVFSLGVVIGSLVSGLMTQRPGAPAEMPFLLSMTVALMTVPAMAIITWRLGRKK